MSTLNDSSDSTDQSFLAQYKLKNLENLIVVMLNINSIRNKFDQLKHLIGNYKKGWLSYRVPWAGPRMPTVCHGRPRVPWPYRGRLPRDPWALATGPVGACHGTRGRLPRDP